MTLHRQLSAAGVGLAALLLVGVTPVVAQDSPSRGDLDDTFCDADGDLVADAPIDPSEWRDPSTLVFAYTPVEDPAVYSNIFSDLIDYLGECTGHDVVYFNV